MVFIVRYIHWENNSIWSKHHKQVSCQVLGRSQAGAPCRPTFNSCLIGYSLPRQSIWLWWCALFYPLLCKIVNDYNRKMLTTPPTPIQLSNKCFPTNEQKQLKPNLRWIVNFQNQEGQVDWPLQILDNQGNSQQVKLLSTQCTQLASGDFTTGTTSLVRVCASSPWSDLFPQVGLTFWTSSYPPKTVLFILMMTFLIIYHTLPLVQLIAINMPLHIPPLHPFSQVPSLWSLKSWLDFEPQFILFSGARALPIYLFTFDQFPVRRNIFLRILFSYLIEYQRYYHSYLIRLAQRGLEANPC